MSYEEDTRINALAESVKDLQDRTSQLEERLSVLEAKISQYGQYTDVERAALRRTQFELAEKGNVVMAIWLGKQMLGQRG